jgi:hypothetical protein
MSASLSRSQLRLSKASLSHDGTARILSGEILRSAHLDLSWHDLDPASKTDGR